MSTSPKSPSSELKAEPKIEGTSNTKEKDDSNSSVSISDAEPVTFVPSDVLHHTILSRIVECLRFTVGPALLDQQITLDSLTKAFIEHLSLVEEKKRAKGLPEIDDFQLRVNDVTTYLHDIWVDMQQHHSTEHPLVLTFAEAFDFEFPLFPETSQKQRDVLLELGHREAITKTDVQQALGLDEGSQIVQFIFAAGADVIPNTVYRDIAGSLDKHPRGRSFARFFFDSIANTGKAMQQLIVHVALVIAILIIGPQVVTTNHIQLFSNTFHWLNYDWDMGCKNGSLAPGSCNFLAREFDTMTRSYTDGLNYAQYELINGLWREEGPRTSPLGAMWPVGAVVLRGVRDLSDRVQSQGACSDLNLTAITKHYEVPATYPCNYDWKVVIPFNFTREQALEEVKVARLPPADDALGTYGIIAHITGMQPSTGLVVYAKAIMSFPRGGGIVPKLEVSTVDTSSSEIILPLLIIKVIGFTWFLISSVHYGIAGLPWVFDLCVETALTAMIATAYGMLSRVSEHTNELNQVTYHPYGLDTAVFDYNNAMSVLAFFCFITLLSTIKYTAYIRGTQLLHDVLSSVAMELLSLSILFVVWSFGFVCVGMILFGTTLTSFATVGQASRTLLYYFAAKRDFDELAESNPIVGPLFFFVYTMFVVFFALNILIAVIAGPVETSKERNELRDETIALTRFELGEKSLWHRVLFNLHYYVTWPIVAICVDATPLWQGHWTKWIRVLKGFYVMPEDMDARSASLLLSAAKEILTVTGGVVTGWDSPLLETMVREKTINDPIAMALMICAIHSESKFNVLRDSRLVHALRDYDEYRVVHNLVLKLQAKLKPAAQKLAAPLTHQIAKVSERGVHHDAVLTHDKSASPEVHGNRRQAIDKSDKGSRRSHHEHLDHQTKTHFSVILESKMSNASRMFFYTITTVIFAIVFFIPFFTNYDTTAFLCRSLQRGLLENEIETRCLEPTCRKVWSRKKPFDDILDFEEYNEWLEHMFIPQIFGREQRGLEITAPGQTLWDPRVTIKLPFYIRQQRSAEHACSNIVDSEFVERAEKLDAGCATAEMTDEDRPYPLNTTVELQQAYKFQHSCAESQPKDYLGRYRDYACVGYSMPIHDLETFEALLAAKWIDEKTRLVVITGNFYFANASGVEYSMFMEFPEKGGGSHGAALPFPLVSDAFIFDLSAALIIFRVLLALDVFLSLCYVIYYLFLRHVKKQASEDVDHLLPNFPWLTALLFLVVFIIAEGAVTRKASYDATIAVCGVIYLEYHLATALLFPAAALLSKKIDVLIRALGNALWQCLVVVPYFVVSIIAFAYLGMICFGRNEHEYSRFRWAIEIVAKMTFTGEVEYVEILESRYLEGQFFIAFFFAFMFVLLFNMFIVIVVVSTKEAGVDSKQVALAEGVLKLFKYRVLHGKFLSVFIYASRRFANTVRQSSLLQAALPSGLSQRRPAEAAVLFQEGRSLFPTEVLVTAIPPLQINELLRNFSVDELNVDAYAALCPFLLKNWGRFIATAPSKAKSDTHHNSIAEVHCARHLVRDGPGFGDEAKGGSAFVKVDHGHEEPRERGRAHNL